MNERFSGLLYDCEIIRCIPSKDDWNEDEDEDLLYCDGWQDFENMGISVIGAFDFLYGRARIFLQDNFDQFQHLANVRKEVIGFNSRAFDDILCLANNVQVETTYDLLEEIRIASGQPPIYTPGLTRGGYNLDALSYANLGSGKIGNGADAPKLWQRGKIGAVIDYCLTDVFLSVQLFERRNHLKDPTDGSTLILRDIEH